MFTGNWRISPQSSSDTLGLTLVSAQFRISDNPFESRKSLDNQSSQSSLGRIQKQSICIRQIAEASPSAHRLVNEGTHIFQNVDVTHSRARVEHNATKSHDTYETIYLLLIERERYREYYLQFQSVELVHELGG